MVWSSGMVQFTLRRKAACGRGYRRFCKQKGKHASDNKGIALVMAAMNVTLRDISPDFAAEFLRDDKVSSRSRGQGIRYCKEGYIHKVRLCRPVRVPKNAAENAPSIEVEPDTIEVSGRCYRSQRKSEKPHSIVLTVGEDKKITDSVCTCMAE